MSRKDVSIDQIVLLATVSLTNALEDAAILAALTPYQMGTAVLQPMLVLLDDVKKLISQQKAEYGDQYQASQDLAAAWEQAKAAYNADLKLARVLFETNADAYGSLLLGGKRKESLSGWLEQARIFYVNLLGKPALLQEMVDHGRTAALLEAHGALVTATATAKAKQESERGEAQQATQDRDTKLDELVAFLSKFRAIAEIALADNPQWLEKLGFGPE